MMTLLRKLFWVALFVVFTLGFVTLFDHGYVTTNQFATDAKSEVHDLTALWRPVTPAKDKSDDVTK
jgi:predicted secreted protein